MDDEDREAEKLYDTIFSEACQGGRNWRELIPAILALPDELQRRLIRALADTPLSGCVPEVLAAKIRYGLPRPTLPHGEPEPKLDGAQLKAAEYLLDHPDAGPSELAREIKIDGINVKKSTAAYWPTPAMRRWIEARWYERDNAIWEQGRAARIALAAQSLAEPLDAEAKAQQPVPVVER